MNRQTGWMGSIFLYRRLTCPNLTLLLFLLDAWSRRQELLIAFSDSIIKGALDNRFLQTQDEITISQAISFPSLGLRGAWADSHAFNVVKTQREAKLA